MAHQNWTYTVLQASVFNEIFTYDIVVTWRTYFAHLGMTAGNNDAGVGEVVRLKLGVDVGGLWGSSGEDEGTKGGDSLR
jgi:hypothetical protein